MTIRVDLIWNKKKYKRREILMFRFCQLYIDTAFIQTSTYMLNDHDTLFDYIITIYIYLFFN